jgi:hypothetical protein
MMTMSKSHWLNSKNLLLVATPFALQVTISWAQSTPMTSGSAFGITMGQKLSSLRVTKSVGNGIYYINVPQPNDEFETYLVIATLETGVCKIRASGKTYSNDDFGYKVKPVFEKFRALLNGKYGISKDYDFISFDALWKKASEWSWSIYKEERHLTSFWDIDSRSSLPDDLQSINLEVSAVSPGINRISLGYEFKNLGRCTILRNQTDSDGL